jgi:hypothetical protein
MKNEVTQLQEVLQKIAMLASSVRIDPPGYSSTFGGVSTAAASITSEGDQPIIGGQVVLTASQRDVIVRALMDLADCLKSKVPARPKADERDKARDAGLSRYLQRDDQRGAHHQASAVSVSEFGNE